jgi:hypothetical protein
LHDERAVRIARTPLPPPLPGVQAGEMRAGLVSLSQQRRGELMADTGGMLKG